MNGAIEVFGGEAGLIIANPNGIDCSGCAFINANRVDLVTGTYNTDTGTFDGISNDITVTSFGLDASSVGILNIQTTNFTNDGVVSTDTFNLSIAGSFNNNNTGSEIDVNTFNLSAAGDFDYTNTGTINTANSFNLNVAGNFDSNDGGNNFIWDANDRLTVEGTANIVADSYTQYGVINVAGAWTIDANGSFTYSNANDFVWGANDSLTVRGNETSIDTYNFDNSGSIDITGSSLEITAGYTVINRGTINATSLVITAADFFRNLTGGNIDVASLNITAGGKVTNTDTINVSGILTITANNDSSRTNDPAGAFFYVSNRGTINAAGFTTTAVDNFYNRGNITTGIFSTSAKDIFLLNEEIASFTGEYDGGTITIGGTSGLITDGGIIENYGNIDLTSDVVLTIVADSFTNQAGATISNGTVDITVTSFINDGSADSATITVNGATIDTSY